ncbi:fatty-acid--CoA ligase [Arthrobacter crystallopoietes BAB-32]|uniref:Fatty-acid--CoA ligase n=1 Tax=Arthrobacter crystallopoietes BAB-32 TaxID=1246476 RepID=N1UY29_9MICC|nr:AMP-binding protein [Arthrobacter crystallopoietes]EMY32747.1 fatty-acid--CoA ligase [Arthrobacter crystallopoietes BAB-32]
MPAPALDVEALLQRYDTPGACAAELLCDAHDPDATAFTIIAADLSSEDITYGQLRQRSERGAAALAELGVGRGDSVATLMGKSADLVVMLLAIWRLGAIHVPLFTAFAWPAIELRLTASGAKVIICDADQRPKIQATSSAVLVAGDQAQAPDLALAPLLATQQPGFSAAAVGGDGTLVLIFTSGTTGTPKGVPVPLRALAAFRQYVELGLDVRDDDVFWNAADPGWAYGLYYGILGPLAAGRRSLLLQAGFSPALSFAVLERFRVTNFAAAPTVYRSMRARTDAAANDIRLRRASSAGEPLTPEVISWAENTLGVPVRDHYGQTEHGMMIVNAWHDDIRKDLREGSMGQPLPGWTCAVLKDASDEPAPPEELGRVAVDTQASPMMWFTGYQDAPEKTAERFSADGRWYVTGDAGKVDADGYFFFSSRDDDVIIMAGYRIGPFDVESVLSKHPAVQETAVIGAPDELRGEVLEAYVVLAAGVNGDEALVTELQELVKTQFAAHAFPRKVHFVESLPKTPSGKLQRYVLRERRKAALE